MMKLLMLKRGLRLLTTTGNVNSSSPLTHRRCFSSLWTSSFSTSSSPLNAAGVSSDSASAAAAAADFNEDFFLGDELARLASKPKTDQNLLQPGVVVYDGVCHLSHNCNILIFLLCVCVCVCIRAFSYIYCVVLCLLL